MSLSSSTLKHEKSQLGAYHADRHTVSHTYRVSRSFTWLSSIASNKFSINELKKYVCRLG